MAHLSRWERAVVEPQMDEYATTPAPRSFGVLMECLEIVSGISQMLQGTSRPGSGHIRLGSRKPQSNMTICSLAPAAELDSSLIQNVKPVELVSFRPCI